MIRKINHFCRYLIDYWLDLIIDFWINSIELVKSGAIIKWIKRFWLTGGSLRI
jgi:hypothetical protein